MTIGKMTHGEVLDSLHFQDVGEFLLTEDFLHYTCNDNYRGGQLYVFVLHGLDGDREIFYLGKAGKGVRARLGQHLGGMKGGSKGGVEAAALIREWLSGGRRVSIWSRASQVLELFGHHVTLEDAEETSLLRQLNPCPFRNKLKVASTSRHIR